MGQFRLHELVYFNKLVHFNNWKELRVCIKGEIRRAKTYEFINNIKVYFIIL